MTNTHATWNECKKGHKNNYIKDIQRAVDSGDEIATKRKNTVNRCL